MPTVAFPKSELVRLLDGVDRSDKEFYDIFRQYGIELDDVVDEPERFTDEIVKKYYLDISANRSDLLCVEGVAAAMRVYMGLEDGSSFHDLKVIPGNITIDVSEDTFPIRPYVVCAVVRNVTMDQIAYNSLIDHQDKLHQNACRRRTLVAIGTHDLDKIMKDAPNKNVHFTYTAEKPEEINFIALNESDSMNGREMFESFTANHRPVAAYQYIIEDKPLWPVIRDFNGRVLSLPPIINGEFSKCEVSTRNIFIECTATDHTKAHIVLNSVINQIRFRSSTPLEVESVRVNYKGPMENHIMVKQDFEITPVIEPIIKEVDTEVLRKVTGVPEFKKRPIEVISPLLARMAIKVEEKPETNGNILICSAPFSRADVMHAIDIIEDFAIGYGYDNISKIAEPVKTNTIGETLKEYKLAELIRQEAAVCGFTECLLYSLCPKRDEIFGDQPVKLANSSSNALFSRARVSLVPGLLDTVSANQHKSLPMRFFECSEIVDKDRFVDEQSPEYKNETGVKAIKHFAAVYAGITAGFQYVHGLLDQLFTKLNVKAEIDSEDDELCVAGNRGAVYLLCDDKQVESEPKKIKIGWIGVIHPKILGIYNVPFPVSVTEIDLELVFRYKDEKNIN